MAKEILFAPRSKHGLLSEYPELSKHEEFKVLKPAEALFVWWYACAASPLFDVDIDDVERIKRAYDEAHKGKSINEAERSRYYQGKLPDVVIEASKRMKTFNMSTRIRAKRMVDKILSNYEHTINVDPSDNTQFSNKDGEIDWTKKKAFIDAQASVVSKLEELVKLSEHSFGIIDTTVANDDEDDDSFIEIYVNQVKQNQQ